MRGAESARVIRRDDRKIVAVIAASLLIAAQFLALAHYHRSDGSRGFAPQTQIANDADLCGLCALVFHAPLSPAAAPVINRPRGAIILAPATPGGIFGSRPLALSLTRAPPSAAL